MLSLQMFPIISIYAIDSITAEKQRNQFLFLLFPSDVQTVLVKTREMESGSCPVLVPFGRVASLYRRADNSRPVFFTASA
jgi:hypothetical protein